MKKLVNLAIIAGFLLSLTACIGVPNNSIFSPDDLENKLVGVMFGSTAEYYAKDSLDLRTFTDSQQLKNDLRSGSIACGIVEAALVKKIFGTKLKTLPDPYVNVGLTFIVAKENKDLTADIDQALYTLSETGTLNTIVVSHMDGNMVPAYEPKTNIDRSRGKLILGAIDNFPPYAYVNEDRVLTGVNIDVANAVCDILGVELEINRMNDGEIIDAVATGKAFFGIGRFFENEVDGEKIDFSKSYADLKLVIVVRKR